jgi:hypothetical protein
MDFIQRIFHTVEVGNKYVYENANPFKMPSIHEVTDVVGYWVKYFYWNDLDEKVTCTEKITEFLSDKVLYKNEKV